MGCQEIATGYGKMLPENDITELVITSDNRRRMNHITGFRMSKRILPPLPQPVLIPMKEKCPRGISKRKYNITGYVASRMVRSKSLRKIVDHTQPVMT